MFGLAGKAAASAGIAALMAFVPMCAGQPTPYNMNGDVTTRGQLIQHYYHVVIQDRTLDPLGLNLDRMTTSLDGKFAKKVINQHTYSMWVENDACASNVVTRQIVNVNTTVRIAVC